MKRPWEINTKASRTHYLRRQNPYLKRLERLFIICSYPELRNMWLTKGHVLLVMTGVNHHNKDSRGKWRSLNWLYPWFPQVGYVLNRVGLIFLGPRPWAWIGSAFLLRIDIGGKGTFISEAKGETRSYRLVEFFYLYFKLRMSAPWQELSMIPTPSWALHFWASTLLLGNVELSRLCLPEG